MNPQDLNPKNFPTTPEIEDNLKELLLVINNLEARWGHKFTVTSGLRTKEDQIRIYKEKARKSGVPFNIAKVPLSSKHLYGQAVDLYDPDLKITEWLKTNPTIMVDLGIWCEQGNLNWVHAQIVSPASGVRWFKP